MTVLGHGWDDTVGYPAFRNVIINGDMSVAQRSTGSVALTTGIVYGSVDRWAAAQATSAAGTIQQITTSLPTGFYRGLRIGRNSSATTTGSIIISQAIETIDSIRLQGKQVTLSFYAKAGANYSATSNALGVQVWTGTGTDQAVGTMGGWTGTLAPIFTTQNITTSWVRYSFTGTVSSTATQIGVYLVYTPTGTAGADDNLYITGVQLEQGSVATPFEFGPFETTLRKCQRYYQIAPNSLIYGVSSSRMVYTYFAGNNFRIQPSVSLTTTTPYVESTPWSVVGSLTGASVSNGHLNVWGGDINIDGTFSPGITTGSIWIIGGGQIRLSAEL